MNEIEKLLTLAGLSRPVQEETVDEGCSSCACGPSCPPTCKCGCHESVQEDSYSYDFDDLPSSDIDPDTLASDDFDDMPLRGHGAHEGFSDPATAEEIASTLRDYGFDAIVKDYGEDRDKDTTPAHKKGPDGSFRYKLITSASQKEIDDVKDELGIVESFDDMTDNEECECEIGDRVKVRQEYGGGTGEVVDIAPSGKFVIVLHDDGEKMSHHISNIELDDEEQYEQAIPEQEEDEDEFDDNPDAMVDIGDSDSDEEFVVPDEEPAGMAGLGTGDDLDQMIDDIVVSTDKFDLEKLYNMPYDVVKKIHDRYVQEESVYDKLGYGGKTIPTGDLLFAVSAKNRAVGDKITAKSRAEALKKAKAMGYKDPSIINLGPVDEFGKRGNSDEEEIARVRKLAGLQENEDDEDEFDDNPDAMVDIGDSDSDEEFVVPDEEPTGIKGLGTGDDLDQMIDDIIGSTDKFDMEKLYNMPYDVVKKIHDRYVYESDIPVMPDASEGKIFFVITDPAALEMIQQKFGANIGQTGDFMHTDPDTLGSIQDYGSACGCPHESIQVIGEDLPVQVGDLSNGYGDSESACGDDYFPTGADNNVVRSVGPASSDQGDNPMQKRDFNDVKDYGEIKESLAESLKEFMKR